MRKQYNFYNIEASFRTFLNAGNPSPSPVTVKNYLSDLRHFLGWLVIKAKSVDINADQITSENIADLLTVEELAQYRAYLRDNGTPIKTINRRLSTIRKFCEFCISEHWIDLNPGREIKNIVPGTFNNEKGLSDTEFIQDFKESLIKEHLDSQDREKTINTIRELLSL